MKRYPVVIEPTSTGFSAYSPDITGCVAVGDTEDETRLNFRGSVDGALPGDAGDRRAHPGAAHVRRLRRRSCIVAPVPASGATLRKPR